MMSDLAEIAAAAGITIIDEDGADEKGNVEAENLYAVKEPVSNELAATEQIAAEQIHNWDIEFSKRYTMESLDYAVAIEAAAMSKRQPCVEGFSCFRQRDDRRNWDRNRRGYGDRGGYRGRGGSSWNSGDRRESSQYQPQSHGDHFNRGHGSQHRRSDSRDEIRSWSNSRDEIRSWSNSNDEGRAYGHHQSRGGHEGYQNRGNVNSQGRQEQQNQHSRSNAGDRWNRNESQGNKDSTRGGVRDRSPQR